MVCASSEIVGNEAISLFISFWGGDHSVPVILKEAKNHFTASCPSPQTAFSCTRGPHESTRKGARERHCPGILSGPSERQVGATQSGPPRRDPETGERGWLPPPCPAPSFVGDEKCIPLAASLTLRLIRPKLALASISTSFSN